MEGTSLSFFFLCFFGVGLVFPFEPLHLFPLFVLGSPRPIRSQESKPSSSSSCSYKLSLCASLGSCPSKLRAFFQASSMVADFSHAPANMVDDDDDDDETALAFTLTCARTDARAPDNSSAPKAPKPCPPYRKAAFIASASFPPFVAPLLSLSLSQSSLFFFRSSSSFSRDGIRFMKRIFHLCSTVPAALAELGIAFE